MGNTQVFRQIDTGSPSLRMTKDTNLTHCSHWHQKLDNLKGLDITQPQLGEAVSSNVALKEVFVPCLDWLVSQIPVSDIGVISAVHDRINHCGAIPNKGISEEILHAWDALHTEKLFDLLERVSVAIANRSSMEDAIREKLDNLEAKRAVSNDASKETSKHWPTLSKRFEVTLLKGEAWSPTRAYTLRVWLEILFFKYWDGGGNLNEARYCLCILNMITWGLDCSSLDLSINEMCALYQMPRLALELDDARAAQSWLDMSTAERQRQHVFSYAPLFDLPQRLTFFRNVNLLTMR
jgi:hypothetical protein